MKQVFITVLILLALTAACGLSMVPGLLKPAKEIFQAPLPEGSPRPENNPAIRLLSEAIQADDRAAEAQATAQVYRAALTSTAQENHDQATRISAAQTSQAQQDMVLATESAIGTATQQQFEIIGWTVTAATAKDTAQAQANGTSTSIAATATESAQRIFLTADTYNRAVIATQTQVALNLLTAQEAAELQRIEDKKRTDALIATTRNMLSAFAPWVLLVALVIAAGYASNRILDLSGRLIRAWAQSKGIVQWMGGKPFFIHTRDDGSVTYVDLSKNLGPAVTVSSRGDVSNPIQAGEAILQRSAAVEGLLALGTGTNRGSNIGQAARITAGMAGGQGQNNQQRLPFIIFTPEQSQLLPTGIRHSLDSAWQQAIEGEFRETDDQGAFPASVGVTKE